MKNIGGLFGISRNSTSSSINRRLKGELIRNKRLKKAVEKLKVRLSKGQEWTSGLFLFKFLINYGLLEVQGAEVSQAHHALINSQGLVPPPCDLR